MAETEHTLSPTRYRPVVVGERFAEQGYEVIARGLVASEGGMATLEREDDEQVEVVIVPGLNLYVCKQVVAAPMAMTWIG